ncbi:hypothetical protein PT974_09475 [Cladobotryum mycophilum]|uniref:HNH nuclease domain-containing protein n=1 Tax=Cladobotryum mycophilum TaxID=491253 RepID=A0ABR0SG95_9HYPO
MPNSSIPTPSLPTLDFVKLGRFITNIEQPLENYHQPSIPDAPPSIVDESFLSQRHQDEMKTSLGCALGRLLSTRFSSKANYSIEFDRTRCKRYSLDNSEAWFDRAIALPETRLWIERAALRRHKIYMIVGFQTLTDPRITSTSAQGKNTRGEFRILNALSFMVSGAVVPSFSPVDEGLHGNHENAYSSRMSYDAPGERICSLKYRKIKHSWLSRRNADKLKLSPTRSWSRNVFHEALRWGAGEDDEEEEDEDMIHVDFDDDDQDSENEWGA